MRINLRILAVFCILLLNIGATEAQGSVYEFTFDGKKYEVVKTKKSWVDAAKYAQDKGAQLAEIDTKEEQLKIFQELMGNAQINNAQTTAPDGGGGAYVWLGGNDIDSEGKWMWDGNNDKQGTQFWQGKVSGSPVGGLYNNWGNEPDDYMNNQDALGFSLNGWPLGVPGQWNDLNKSNQLFFIVEYPAAVKAIEVGSVDINFEKVGVDIPKETTIEINCNGNSDLKFDGVEILPAGSIFTADVSAIPASLESGKKYLFKVTFLPTEAKHYTAKLIIKTDADAGNLEINLQGDGSSIKKLELIGDKNIDFGKVEVKETADKNIEFKVMGASNIDFTEIKIDGDDQIFTVDASTIPSTLEVGKTYTFKVTFAPTDEKEYIAKLAVKTNADNGDLELDLKGSGKGTKTIEIVGLTEIVFGAAEIGETNKKTIEFECTGNLDVNFSGIEISPDNKTFTADASSISKTLEVGKKYSFIVSFAPYTIGDQTAKLLIKTDADAGDFEINLKGEGTAIGSVDDMYEAGGAVLSPISSNTSGADIECSFKLPQAGKCALKIYDTMGNDMNISVSKNYETGVNTEILGASALNSGAYFLVLEYGTFQLVRKFVVNK